MSVKDEINAQIIEALKGTEFPINTPEELLNSFPEGANTTCKSGDIEVTAGEAGKLLKPDDFPFNNSQEVADTIVNRANL